MRLVLRVVAVLLVLVLVVTGGLLVGARFHDGPIALIPGGPFTSGTLVAGPEPDWSFVHDVREVQFQLLDPERSRTTSRRTRASSCASATRSTSVGSSASRRARPSRRSWRSSAASTSAGGRSRWRP
jgi:hypothetical protein